MFIQSSWETGRTGEKAIAKVIMAENFLRTDIDNNSEAKEGQRNSNRITKKKDT